MGAYGYIIFRDIYLHNLNGVAEKRQHPNRPGFKVKLILSSQTGSTATNRSLLAHRYNFVGNSSGKLFF